MLITHTLPKSAAWFAPTSVKPDMKLACVLWFIQTQIVGSASPISARPLRIMKLRKLAQAREAWPQELCEGWKVDERRRGHCRGAEALQLFQRLARFQICKLFILICLCVAGCQVCHACRPIQSKHTYWITIVRNIRYYSLTDLHEAFLTLQPQCYPKSHFWTSFQSKTLKICQLITIDYLFVCWQRSLLPRCGPFATPTYSKLTSC